MNKPIKKTPPIWVIVISAITIIVFVLVVIYFTQPSNLLAQYITHRTCDFIEFGELHAAVCTDGSQWSVSPFLP